LHFIYFSITLFIFSMTGFCQLTCNWPNLVIISKVNKYCCVGQKSNAILLPVRISVLTEYITKCLKPANKLHLFLNVAIIYIFKHRTTSLFKVTLLCRILWLCPLWLLLMANWLLSVQKPMGDDPVQSLESDQFSHTPIPLSSFHFLPYKPKFSWRFVSLKF
jgi:hypothetical protein